MDPAVCRALDGDFFQPTPTYLEYLPVSTKEFSMNNIDRRTAILGASAAAVALAGTSKETRAEAVGTSTKPAQQEGVSRTELSSGPSMIPGYQRVVMRDTTVQPGRSFGPNKMENAMVCHMLEGEMEITQDMGVGTFTARKNHVWTCNTGMMEGGVNKGKTPAIMRITHLFPK
jgi:hypothetical protein